MTYNFPVKDNYVGKRAFLNSQESMHSGSVKLAIYVTKLRKLKSEKKDEKCYEFDGTLEIRDCIKRIDLMIDGDTRDKEGAIKLLNSRDKLNRIIEVCEEGIDAIESAFLQGKFKGMVSKE